MILRSLKMKDRLIIILAICVFEAFCNTHIAYKAKFMGNMKVAGDSRLVYALSVTHCLALCNKDPGCDGINFFDDMGKCRLFRQCAITKVIQSSKHYFYYSRRPPISNPNYFYEAHSDSCVRLTEEESAYHQTAKSCEREDGYLSSLNSPALISLASELLAIKNRTQAWISPPSRTELHSMLYSWKSRGEHQARSKRSAVKKCRVLNSGNVTETTMCQTEKRFGVCQIPTY